MFKSFQQDLRKGWHELCKGGQAAQHVYETCVMTATGLALTQVIVYLTHYYLGFFKVSWPVLSVPLYMTVLALMFVQCHVAFHPASSTSDRAHGFTMALMTLGLFLGMTFTLSNFYSYENRRPPPVPMSFICGSLLGPTAAAMIGVIIVSLH